MGRRGDTATGRSVPVPASSRPRVCPSPRVSAGRILEEHLWTPRLAACSIGPDKAETGSGSIKKVHVGVANVVVRLSLELGLHIGELVFQHGEVNADVILGPDLLLVPDRTVRTAPDEVSQGLRVAHHVHGNDTGGITHFQRSVDVKANELGQA
jgi:hypothetical protein